MSTWKKADVRFFSGGTMRIANGVAEYRIGDLNMTQTVSCICGRRYLTQAQADICPHERPEPEPERKTGLGQWANDLHITKADLTSWDQGPNVVSQSRRIPGDGFHGVSYDDDR